MCSRHRWKTLLFLLSKKTFGSIQQRTNIIHGDLFSGNLRLHVHRNCLSRNNIFVYGKIQSPYRPIQSAKCRRGIQHINLSEISIAPSATVIGKNTFGHDIKSFDIDRSNGKFHSRYIPSAIRHTRIHISHAKFFTRPNGPTNHFRGIVFDAGYQIFHILIGLDVAHRTTFNTE